MPVNKAPMETIKPGPRRILPHYMLAGGPFIINEIIIKVLQDDSTTFQDLVLKL